jgi:serine protease AprX
MLRRAATAAALLLAVAACAPGDEPALEAALRAAGRDGEVPVIVRRAPAEVRAPLASELARPARVAALRAEGEQALAPVRERLARRGVAAGVPLWVIGAVAVRASPAAIRALLRDGDLEVTLDAAVSAPATVAGVASAPPEWNLAAVGAPTLWARGVTGVGAVVASLDTGASVDHPDLAGGWRAGPGGWLDPFRHTALPYDPAGHGTQTLGVVAGGAAGGTAIGVAPGARWIAAKIYDDAGRSTVSVIHQAFQWVLDPDGDPATDDTPDVVTASWGALSANACDLTFAPDLAALRSAGILVVAAAGNAGPAPATSVSPANNPGAFSAGAVDATGAVWAWSSRGPSACTGGVFPDVVAPGVDVWTAERPAGGVPGYAVVTGTSIAAPHVAGAAALLRGAFPAATVEDLERALRVSARDVGVAGPDGDAGWGQLDVARAWAQLARRSPLAVVTTSLPPARAGVPYAAALVARGGAGARAWSVTAGALPPGVAVGAETGVLSGTAPEVGTWYVEVEVADASGQSAHQLLRIAVEPATLPAVGTAALPPAVLGTRWSAAIAGEGGTPPYAWSLAGGALPGGVALEPTGFAAGTPAEAGTFDFTVRLTDAQGLTATRALSLAVAQAPLEVTSRALRSCAVGFACARVLSAAGGLPPYAWATRDGALPPGLLLNPVTGALAGTPSAAGTFTLAAQVTDAAGATAARQVTIAVLLTGSSP